MTLSPEKAVQQIRKSLERRELAVVVGTGVSIALTDNKIPALSWTGLIKHGLMHGEAIGKVSPAQHARRLEDLGSPDLDDLLGAAEFVGAKLGAPDGDLYAKWLRDAFTDVEPQDNPVAAALKSLASHGAPLATLNYDPLLEKLLNRHPLTLDEKPRLADWMRGDNPGVLHLHGFWDKPHTCVLGVRDYDRTLSDEFRQLVQRQLGGFRRLLFIGCGDTFADPNFTNFIGWLRQHVGAAAPQHFALTLDGEVDKRLKDQSWQGFVEPLGFGPAHGDLPEFLLKHFPASAQTPSSPPLRPAADPEHAAQLEAYRQFILRDCGSTTVEGLNPGMDIASRRFRLEDIFVPLEVLPAGRPSIAVQTGIVKETHLIHWEQEEIVHQPLGSHSARLVIRDKKTEAKNSHYLKLDEIGESEPLLDVTSAAKKFIRGPKRKTYEPYDIEHSISFSQSFGKCFEKNPRIALLALPGGGKTMLLKRLTVAYADQARLTEVSDQLSNQDLYPVLIRCRDWRKHINLPVPTLLRKLDEVTGQADLKGFDAALAPLLQAGKVLLLVDGLDEIHDDGDRQTFVDHLATFIQDHSKIRLVVTSREAGFSIIAPKIARFCHKWRLAPLSNDAIGQLCRRWHRLTAGEATDADRQGEETAARLIDAPALRRLAENPLLLTMLLVVQHGGGGVLPADRVTLYNRAVEVLLDTWNVQGHPQLRVKEAVPQLAFVAYEMMRAGKQTVTESELLDLLVRARNEAPNVRHFAVDPPDVFLKRVELRSSLLVEVGRREEGGRTTPFYQFRHLTFQEYLTAVAVVEGHTPGYQHGDNILKPLRDYLTTDEWKEVVPMAAALAKNNAEPLLAALVTEGIKFSSALIAGKDFQGKEEWQSFYPSKPPASIVRLTQCLIEEAAPAPKTLDAAIDLILPFAKGGANSIVDWHALFSGLYAEDFWRCGWELYQSQKYPRECKIRDALFIIIKNLTSTEFKERIEYSEIAQYRQNFNDNEKISRMLLENYSVSPKIDKNTFLYINLLLTKIGLNINNFAIIEVIIDIINRSINATEQKPLPEVLDGILYFWLDEVGVDLNLLANTIGSCCDLERDYWKPNLFGNYKRKIKEICPHISRSDHAACLVVSFHARGICSDKELARRIFRHAAKPNRPTQLKFTKMLRQLGPLGEEYARRLEESRS